MPIGGHPRDQNGCVAERPTILRLTRLVVPFRDRFRSYRVVIDGRRVGRLPFGETREFEITSGEHALQVRLDWTGSPRLTLQAAEGEVVEYECAASGSGFTSLHHVLSRTRAIRLDRRS